MQNRPQSDCIFWLNLRTDLDHALCTYLSIRDICPHVQVTHLFRDVLHGWGRVLLSVNVSPCARDYDETSHVLKVQIPLQIQWLLSVPVCCCP